MIKLTNILNELSINNPAITPEKMHKYYERNINIFRTNSPGWQEYKELCEPYMEKYNILIDITWLSDFKKIIRINDRINLYQGMRQIVRKYVGEEILNELSINKPIKVPLFNKPIDLKLWLEEKDDNLKYFINLLPIDNSEKLELLENYKYIDTMNYSIKNMDLLYLHLDLNHINIYMDIVILEPFNYEYEEMKLPKQTLYLIYFQ